MYAAMTPGDSVPRFEQMTLRWQNWAEERTAYIRFFDSVAAAGAFPEYPEVSDLALEMQQVWVIYSVDSGLPMKLRGTLAASLADAAANSFVVVSIDLRDFPRSQLFGLINGA